MAKLSTQTQKMIYRGLHILNKPIQRFSTKISYQETKIMALSITESIKAKLKST